MGLRLPPVRVCVYLLFIFFLVACAQVSSNFIPDRAQLNITRVFFHEGIGFKYNLVCTCRRSTHIYIA